MGSSVKFPILIPDNWKAVNPPVRPLEKRSTTSSLCSPATFSIRIQIFVMFKTIQTPIKIHSLMPGVSNLAILLLETRHFHFFHPFCVTTFLWLTRSRDRVMQNKKKLFARAQLTKSQFTPAGQGRSGHWEQYSRMALFLA